MARSGCSRNPWPKKRYADASISDQTNRNRGVGELLSASANFVHPYIKSKTIRAAGKPLAEKRDVQLLLCPVEQNAIEVEMNLQLR